MSKLTGKFEFGIIALLGVVAACFYPASDCLGQSRVFVAFEDEMLPVVAMDGATPLIDLSGQRIPVVNAYVRVDPAPAYADGSLEVLERKATIGRDYGSNLPSFYFRFEAMVQAESDLEDCFALFIVTYALGEETYYIREIQDIKSTGSERIVVTLPIDSTFGEGEFSYRVFSRGQEIRRYEPDDQLVVKAEGASSPSGRMPAMRRSDENPGIGQIEAAKAIKARLLNYPKSLSGTVDGGYAMAVFSIDEKGRAVELVELKAEQVEFIPEVWKTIVETQYRPGSFNGKPMLTTVRQNFFFNEFAPFAEGLEVLPYSDLKQRKAWPIYAPMPDIKGSKEIVVKLEVVVNKLGRVISAQAVEAADTDAAKTALDTIQDWIFLPAIVEGYLTEQRLVIPIRFLAAK